MKKYYIGAVILLLLAALGVSAYFIFISGDETKDATDYEIISNSLNQNARFIDVYTQNTTDDALIGINDQLVAEYPQDDSQHYLTINYFDDRDVAVRYAERRNTTMNQSTEQTIVEGSPDIEAQEELMDHLIAAFRSDIPGSNGELKSYKTGKTIKRY